MHQDDIEKQVDNYKINYIPDENKPPKNHKKYVILNVVLFSLCAVLLVLLIVFTAVFTTVKVSGDSMYPTLKDGDRIFLQISGYDYTYGDIVVFTRTDSEGKSVNAVKRVIALGGDIVSFDRENNKWLVNGNPIEETYFNGEYSSNYFDKIYDTAIYDGGITIPENCLFVLGDNRNILGGSLSVDSHIYGPIPAESVVGKVLRVF